MYTNDTAHSPEHNSENRIKKFQTVQTLQKFQNRVLADSLVPLSEKFQCTSLIFRGFYVIRGFKLKEYLNVQNIMICTKNLLCLNDFTFFDY